MQAKQNRINDIIRPLMSAWKNFELLPYLYTEFADQNDIVGREQT